MSRSYTTDTARWQAISNKDREAAHLFYYAVKTTGIYCIAGCASRLPKRENVLFFDTPTKAEAAGFRACKRCRPNDSTHAGISSQRVVQACRTMEQAEEEPSLETLAADAGLTSSHFQRLFKGHVGLSPKEYGRALRDSRVRAALEAGHSVTRAIVDAGFSSSSRFYEQSGQAMGMPARTYRKGGKGLTIHYVAARSFLGPILAAFTDQGVCSIEFGQSEEQLVHSLSQRFHQADIVPGGSELRSLVSEIVDFIQSPDKALDLPLDIQGTAFQQRVWKALQDIPAGETRTYTDVAHAMGIPQSVRAVAAACAKNRLAVVIPCHRVVRKDGSLAGYYWGLERKAALLENET